MPFPPKGKMTIVQAMATAKPAGKPKPPKKPGKKPPFGKKPC
jgi:hypothetical protein